ncbi:ATP-binding protein, partial [Streptomyces sp. DH12]|uniref:ATP-binding protein n=1 Tax=Streptomyces sp. DH12 TaxID=2857010 RepID=UPI001E5ED979
PVVRPPGDRPAGQPCPSRPAEVREAVLRAVAERCLATRTPCDTEALADALLVASELTTNAILHGEGPVRLRLIHDGERLLAEVTDASSAGPHLRHARHGDESGRGLYIVMRLSAHWGLRHGREDKTIWS